MKKIAHILSMGEYSGAEKIVIEICDNLKDNYEFMYICKPGSIEEYLKEKNINYITYNSIKELIKIIRSNSFNLIHAHDYTASMISAFFAKCKVISHIHNNNPFAKTLNLKSFIYNVATKRIDQIWCVSQSIIDEMYFKYNFKDKLEVVYNWVNVNERYWEEELEKNTDVLFVGRFTEQKNPILFLEVIKKIKESTFHNIKVKMIGRGELKEEILSFIENKGLSENIEILDFTKIPHKYMKESKIFFVPSKWEGFGLVFLEAIANKCVVVATPVGGIKEIFKDKTYNLSYEEEELVEIIKKILTDKKHREKSISDSNEILSNFDMMKNINKIDAKYKELLKSI